MNAIRQIVTPDTLGNLPIQVPVELRERPVEVIIVPIGETNDSMLSVLTKTNAISNAWKIIRKAQLGDTTAKYSYFATGSHSKWPNARFTSRTVTGWQRIEICSFSTQIRWLVEYCLPATRY